MLLLLQVNESNSGREHIIPSIVQFGFGLLEGVEEVSKRRLDNSDDLLGVEELGSQMLKSSFEVHDMARKEVSMRMSIDVKMDYHTSYHMDTGCRL